VGIKEEEGKYFFSDSVWCSEIDIDNLHKDKKS